MARPEWIRFAPLLGLAFVQCREVVRTHNWFAMDTNMSVSLYGESSLSDEEVFARLEAETERLGNLFSDYSLASPVAKMIGSLGDTLAVDPEIYPVLAAALEAGESAQGVFDITLHDLKALWGIGSGENNRVPDSSEIDSVMAGNPVYRQAFEGFSWQPPLLLLPDNRAVLLRENCRLDLGAIAKGHIVDRLHAILDSLGLSDHIIQAGGDIRLGGKKSSGPWILGIRHPRSADSLSGRISLSTAMAVSTSGDYERFFEANGERYHHILDPRTGRPARGVSSVTVLAGSGIVADVLSTSLFVLGPDKGAELARRYQASAVWFKALPEGICAIAMPEISDWLQLGGVASCPSM